MVNIEGYKHCVSFCRMKNKMGGVCIFTAKSITAIPICLTSYCVERDFECCASKIDLDYQKLTILCVYRSPSGNINNFISKLESVLFKLSKGTRKIILCGDFNINFLLNNNDKMNLLDMLNTFNLRQTVTFPTRITTNTATLIDNIFVNGSMFELTKTCALINGLSDHDGQIIYLSFANKLITQNKMCKRVRDLSHINISYFKQCLLTQDWIPVLEETNSDNKFNLFHSIFIRLFENCFPVKSVNLNNKVTKTWITTGIKVSCKRKRELFEMCRNSNDLLLNIHYKRYCKILKRVIVQAKRIEIDKQILKSENKVKTTWNIVKKELGKDSNYNNNTITLKSVNNGKICKPELVADTFNKYFISVVDSLLINDSTKNINEYLYEIKDGAIPDIQATLTVPREIEYIIKSLKPKKSHGFDGVPSLILQSCAELISIPLSDICNCMLITGVFPDRLKTAIIKPIYKKDDRESERNYRPISLLSVFAKVLEKVIYGRLIKHLDQHNILSPSQFGFRKGLSTISAAYHLTTNILSKINNKHNVLGLFCDLSKAFDCINHEVLSKKLQLYGINENYASLIKTYLENRKQKVAVYDIHTGRDIVSNSGSIRHGVPQGSILGPLLFLLYINDLPDYLGTDTTTVLFADDTSILISERSQEELENKSNEILCKLTKWFSMHNLILNSDKTNCIRFTTKNKEITEINLNYLDNSIQNVTSVKFLGFELDNKLNWKAHIHLIIKKLSSACYSLRCLSQLAAKKTLKSVYYAYFHSIMSYGIIFWGFSTDAKKVFLLQKRAIRTICNKQPKESCRKSFIEEGILTLIGQFIFKALSYISQNLTQFQMNQDVHRYKTRNNTNIHVPYTYLTTVQKGSFSTLAKIFNTLPNYYKKLCISNPSQFRANMKKFLLNNSFYTFDEYVSKCSSINYGD